ncbi:hypothetical protein [Bifidobacterium bifidum]
MRESTLITKSSIRRASPQLRLRTGLAWGIAVAITPEFLRTFGFRP